MELTENRERTVFRGEEITSSGYHFVCATCGFTAASIAQASARQRSVADIYRRKKGLLTAREIREGRKRLNLSQKGLARVMRVGIASIKRWEGGTIQTPAMDRLLRQTLHGRSDDAAGGNRVFSLARVRLVLLRLSSLYGRDLLKQEDIAVNSCLLWYADMTAHRLLGRSLTGAGYSVLPTGPFLNNFRELMPLLLKCDETTAEPLSAKEEEILGTVHRAFPSRSEARRHALREPIWQQRQLGEEIPYGDSALILNP